MLLLTAILCAPFNMSAQITIGSGVAPREFSVLELISDGERGLRLPKMNTAQRNAMRDAFLADAYYELAYGLFIFNTDNGGCIEFWNGTRWISLCDDGFLTDGFRQRDPASAVVLYDTSHTFELPFASDGICTIGPITYLWQQRTDGDWGPVPGVPNNLAHLTTPNLTVTTEFRRLAMNACGDTIRTAAATVTVLEFDLTLPLEGIVVNPSNVHRTIGWVGIPFGAIITPFDANQSVTWSSSRPDIAFIDPATGMITAIAAGVATITATSVSDPSRTASATINVFPHTPLTTPHPAHAWVPNGGTHTFILGTAQGAGGIGSFTYQWQGSIDGLYPWHDMTVNANGQHFTTPVFNAVEPTEVLGEGGLPAGTLRYFRRLAFSGEHTEASLPARITVFATRNVSMQPGLFVAEPGHLGAFFQWNRNLAHSVTNPRFNSDGNNSWDTTSAPGTAWYYFNDPCPNGWRVPTEPELRLLNSNRLNPDGTTLYARELSMVTVATALSRGFTGVTTYGQIFPRGARGDGTGTPGIFLPAARSRDVTGTLLTTGVTTYFWSSTPSGASAWTLRLLSGNSIITPVNRAQGFLVRCVAE